MCLAYIIVDGWSDSQPLGQNLLSFTSAEIWRKPTRVSINSFNFARNVCEACLSHKHSNGGGPESLCFHMCFHPELNKQMKSLKVSWNESFLEIIWEVKLFIPCSFDVSFHLSKQFCASWELYTNSQTSQTLSSMESSPALCLSLGRYPFICLIKAGKERV